MEISLEKVLRVRRQEQPLLLLLAATIALFQFSQIINENFAEMVFLKRFGVFYLPNALFFNSLAFLVLLAGLNTVIDRIPRSRLVSRLLLLFAGTLLVLRLLIILRVPLTYPIIYISIKQMKYVFFIVFWTLATDIYSTRKARRVFPLIGGGAVIGCIAGSLLSRRVATAVGTNNILIVTGAGMLLTFFLVEIGSRQRGRFSAVSFSPGERVTAASFGKFLRRELVHLRGTSLLGFLIILSLLPGIVAPIFDYLFNYLADKTYVTEQSLLGFFGVFKGLFNILILFCQVVIASGLFRRYGIVNLLFSHPVGYLLTFGGLYFRFRMPMAMLGKAGLEIIDASFYKPGRQMLYNIIPAELRGRASVLVQGAIPRLGELVGSGFLTLLKDFISPVNLNLIGAPLAIVWVFYTRRLKQHYSTILFQSLKDQHVNFSELEARDLCSLVTGEAHRALVKRLGDDNPDTALMAARLLAQSGIRGWPKMICERLSRRDDAFQTEIVRLVGTGQPSEAVPALLGVAGEIQGLALSELLLAVRRMDARSGESLFRAGLTSPHPRVVAEALLGLRAMGERVDVGRVEALLNSRDSEKIRSAVYLLGEIGDEGQLGRVLPLADSPEPYVRAECAVALGKLGLDISHEIWPALLGDRSAMVRYGAVEGLSALEGREAVELVIPLLGDEDGGVRDASRLLIESHGEAVIPLLTRALSEAGLFTRAALIRILDNLGVKEQTLLGFIDGKIEGGYRVVGKMCSVEELPLGRSGEMLSLLLRNRLNEATDEVFRMLTLLLKGSRTQFILDSYQDRDRNVREHALEALENMLTPVLARRLLPLLEDAPLQLKLLDGSRYYRIGITDLHDLLGEMLASSQYADVLCALMCIQEARRRRWTTLPCAVLECAAAEEEKLRLKGGDTVEGLMEKVLTLKGIPIFAHLQFKELLAIASISREERFYAGDTIIREGERGYSMYIVTSGTVRIVSRSGGEEVLLATIRESDYFGEMSLFDDAPRSATAIAEGEVRVLRINKREFLDMLREYPGVSIMMCEEFCRRLRHTTEKVSH